MTPFMSFAANHLWQSTLITAVVWLLTLMLKSNRASTRYWLWLAASVKFLVPFSLLIGLGGQFGSSTIPAMPPDFSAAIQQVSEPFDQIQFSSGSAESTSAAPSTFLDYIPAPLLTVWLCGSFGLLLSWRARWRRISEALRLAQPSGEGLVEGIRVMASGAALEPGVVGIFRPVLLLPAGIESVLDKGQLEAVIAHEVAHVHRRDNLAAAFHMLVEAVFWFHPLVWWLGARLVDERERACDEEVLRSGSEPQVYAEGILRVCEFYLHSPLTCASGITSSNLRRRVEEIMMNRAARRLSFMRKMLLGVAALGSLAIPVTIGFLNASPLQSPPSPLSAALPSFEVASVRANKSGGARSRSDNLPGGHFRATNVTLRTLILGAYSIPEYLLSGGPDWIDSDRFDVDAKAEANAIPPGTSDKDRWKKTGLMVQTLLADRFKLKAHFETKEGPVYVLSVAKTGAKLQKAPDRECSQNSDTTSYCHGFSGGPRGLKGQTVDTDDIAEALSRFVGRPIQDMTGLKGVYDIQLQWTPGSLRGVTPEPRSPEAERSEPGVIDPFGADLFTALQEQLGLKLESKTGPVRSLVIDSAERPADNVNRAAGFLPAVSAVVPETSANAPHLQSMSFEVATIKPDPPGNGGGLRGNCLNGRCEFRHHTLKRLIAYAYDLNPETPLIVEGPDWSDSTTYAIEAITENRANVTRNETRQMLQALLADRFKLKVHRETKEIAGYALVVGKTGSKLKESRVGEEHVAQPRTFGQVQPPTKGPQAMFSVTRSGSWLTAYEQSGTMLADFFSGVLRAVVVDKTELKGLYDCELKWTPDERQMSGPLPPGLDDTGPTIFAAIQEQIGLKLESQKVVAQFIVIDHADKPTGN